MYSSALLWRISCAVSLHTLAYSTSVPACFHSSQTDPCTSKCERVATTSSAAQTPCLQSHIHVRPRRPTCILLHLFLYLSPYHPTPQIRLSELIRRKHPLLRHQAQVLIRRAEGVIVQALDMPIASPQRDVVEARDGEAGLGVGGGDEAAFCTRQGSAIRLMAKYDSRCMGVFRGDRTPGNLTFPPHQHPPPPQLLPQPPRAHQPPHAFPIAQALERLQFPPVSGVDTRIGRETLRLQRVPIEIDDLALEEGGNTAFLRGRVEGRFLRHVERFHRAGEGHVVVVDAVDGNFDGPAVGGGGGQGERGRGGGDEGGRSRGGVLRGGWVSDPWEWRRVGTRGCAARRTICDLIGRITGSPGCVLGTGEYAAGFQPG